MIESNNKDKPDVIADLFYSGNETEKIREKLIEISDKKLPDKWRNVCSNYGALERVINEL